MGAKTAKLFTHGRSQAVRLPMEFRFKGRAVFIPRDPATGDVILSPKPNSWDGLFALYGQGEIPDDFMGAADRDPAASDRDPFTGFAKVLASVPDVGTDADFEGVQATQHDRPPIRSTDEN